jgi:diguanylate cyclase (GGDEF)-like protein
MHRPLSLILIDVDDFKAINDTLGHPSGDKVLKSVAEAIHAQTRECDLCARYGGDEFAVLLANSNISQASVVAERIRQNTVLLDHLFACIDMHPKKHPRLTVTLSIGVAQLAPDMTAEAFIEAADQALYHSKNSGKNRVSVFRPDLFKQPHPRPLNLQPNQRRIHASFQNTWKQFFPG